MMTILLTHLCVTWPQRVNSLAPERCGRSLNLAIFKLIHMYQGQIFSAFHVKLPSCECHKTSLMMISQHGCRCWPLVTLDHNEFTHCQNVKHSTDVTFNCIFLMKIFVFFFKFYCTFPPAPNWQTSMHCYSHQNKNPKTKLRGLH